MAAPRIQRQASTKPEMNFTINPARVLQHGDPEAVPLSERMDVDPPEESPQAVWGQCTISPPPRRRSTNWADAVEEQYGALFNPQKPDFEASLMGVPPPPEWCKPRRAAKTRHIQTSVHPIETRNRFVCIENDSRRQPKLTPEEAALTGQSSAPEEGSRGPSASWPDSEPHSGPSSQPSTFA
jgi:hypothetical protein